MKRMTMNTAAIKDTCNRCVKDFNRTDVTISSLQLLLHRVFNDRSSESLVLTSVGGEFSLIVVAGGVASEYESTFSALTVDRRTDSASILRRMLRLTEVVWNKLRE